MTNFNKLYNELRPYVFNFIRMKTRDSDLAEDLTNDTMLKVYNNLDKFDEEKGKINTWVVRIANNVLIDHWRKKKLNTTSIDEFVDDEGNNTFHGSDNVTPHSEMVNTQIGEGIEMAFGKLPEKYKELADLFFKKQLSYEEISDELNAPLGTIKANIHRTRKILQGYLNK
jgi:RNA polymerase sigma-70 factor (ECF subfamily)